MFPTIEYVDRVSHFDPASDYHDLRGFFILFWIVLAIMVLTSMLRQVKETGYPFQITQWDLFNSFRSLLVCWCQRKDLFSC